MKRLLFLALVVTPLVVNAQKKDDELRSIQRDIAQLEDDVKTLKKAQDDKFAQLLAAIQASGDSQGKATAAIAALQRDIDKQLADMLTKLAAPAATLGSKIDQMTDDFRAVGNLSGDLVKKVNAIDQRLTDMESLMRTIAANQTAPTPPPPTVVNGQAAASAKPACAPAETLWETARGDYTSGSFEDAVKEYIDYVKCYSDTANAPEAQYQIGYIYFNNNQFDSAATAFQVVIDKWPENQKSQEAKYYLAVSLMKNGQKTEAGKAFLEYINAYPRGKHVEQAHANRRALGLERTAAKKRP